MGGDGPRGGNAPAGDDGRLERIDEGEYTRAVERAYSLDLFVEVAVIGRVNGLLRDWLPAGYCITVLALLSSFLLFFRTLFSQDLRIGFCVCLGFLFVVVVTYEVLPQIRVTFFLLLA